MNHRRPRDDFSRLGINHPARRMLRQYKHTGAPVVTKDAPWSREKLSDTLLYGAHKSCNEYDGILRVEFASMQHKQQYIVLPYEVGKHLPGLHLSPPGVVP